MLAWLNVTDGWGVKPEGGTLSDPVKKLRIVLVVSPAMVLPFK